MRRRNFIWKTVLFSAWLIWLLDIGTKTWALSYLSDKEKVKVVGNLLTLTLTKNSGAAFSLATGGSILLGIFSILVIFAIGYIAPRITSRPWGYVLGLVLGGSLGNLSDRLFRSGPNGGVFKGEVVDWIQLPHWPIFNIADSAIVTGAVVAAYLAFRNIAPISNEQTKGKSNFMKSSQNEEHDGS